MRSSTGRWAIHGLAAFVAGAFSTSAQVKLYWTATDASGAYAVRANGDGSNPTNIVSGAANILGPNGLEYFNGLLYWPDQQLNAVRQVKPDGSGMATFTTAQNPYDVFANAQQVYWTSQQRTYIDTQLINGTGYQRILASPDVTSPFAIEVTASNIFWSEVSGLGRIRRSDLHGSNIVTVIPNVFVYDLQITSNYIYFADNNFPGGIKRANLDGSSVATLVPGGPVFHGLCVTDDAIYWAAFLDGDGGGIRRANLNGSNSTNLYNAPSGTSVRGVVVLSDVGTAAPLRFTNYIAGSGKFSFTLQVESGKTYRIETSGNLTNWIEITNFVSTGTTFTLTNVIPAGASNLFFRARTP